MNLDSVRSSIYIEIAAVDEVRVIYIGKQSGHLVCIFVDSDKIPTGLCGGLPDISLVTAARPGCGKATHKHLTGDIHTAHGEPVEKITIPGAIGISHENIASIGILFVGLKVTIIPGIMIIGRIFICREVHAA